MDRLICGSLATIALVAGAVASSAQALPGPGRTAGQSDSMIERVDSYKHHHRHYYHDSDDSHVRAPFASVDNGRWGTHVEAPFATVHDDRYGTYVRAPFVNLFIPR